MDQVLNYVWINRRAQAPGQFENPVPGPYCDNAIKIARRYPKTAIIIWIDKALLNPASCRLVDARFATVSNITVSDLRDIPTFANDPIFQPPEQGAQTSETIWRRVDYARLLVLHHVLHAGAAAAFYSDFDIVDPQLRGDRLRAIFHRHGLVFGEAPPEPVENQFMGFRADQISLLSDWWIPETRTSLVEKGECSGFAAFLACLEMYETCTGVNREDISVPTHELVL